MAPSSVLRSAILATALYHVIYAKYALVRHYSPGNFFDGFSFYTGPDPTNGFVEYVNRTYAHSNGLISTHGTHVRIGVDHTNAFPVNALGRPSVRLQSHDTYNQGLFILSLNHMPYGCGTWPAFWTLGPAWPTNGEIDIIEGVNTNTFNVASLHSGPDCTIAGIYETGTLLTNNCTSTPESNIGCGVEDSSPYSYGAGFNAAGGGVYAMQWTGRHIRTWFFTHGHVPESIKRGEPDPHTFGKPNANLKGSCDIETSFNDHQLIFDMTFCGDYAGQTYYLSDCPNAAGGYAACTAFVAGTPTAFQEAYWSINYLKAYQRMDALGTDPKLGDHRVLDSPQQISTPISSVRPAAATSTLLSQSLMHAGMGVPVSITKTTEPQQFNTKVAKKKRADATPSP